MNKLFLTIAASALAFSPTLAQSNPNPAQSIAARYAALMQDGRNKSLNAKSSIMRIEQKGPDSQLEGVSSWGTLYSPDGEIWMYTAEYNKNNPESTSIESVDLTVYDADFKPYSTVSMQLELGENETSINLVQIAPTLTKKFFNYDDYIEIMVYVHATTTDYTGHQYTNIISLKDGALLETIDGNQIGAVNTALDEWSEKYTMAFMREEIDEDWNYTMYFDIYEKAEWGSNKANLSHTFKVDYSTFSGGGDMALPFLMSVHNSNEIFYALPHYEKPYFAESDDYFVENPDVTPDNNFIIELYNSKYELVHTTVIPMEVKEGYDYTFPGIGEMYGFEDMYFGYPGAGNDPVYIVGYENYLPASDDFMTDLCVYDINGRKLATVMEDAMDYIGLSDVNGFERQTCFVTIGDQGEVYNMVDFPSCQTKAHINARLDDGNIVSNLMDRVKAGDSYKYVASLTMAESNALGEALHKFMWFNADGSFDRFDSINLGTDVSLALPYVNQEAFDPFLFNTDENLEYMFLVKHLVNPAVSSKAEEQLRIYNDKSNLILELGNDPEAGALSSVFLTNPGQANGKLVVIYYADDIYTTKLYNLPLYKFSGGDGSVDDPYLISTTGDLCKMYTEPKAFFALANDINFKDVDFTSNPGSFTGSLDGRNFIIRNISLNGGGIFESVDSKGVVKNLRLSYPSLTSDNGCGFIASHSTGESASSHPTFDNIHVYGGTVEGGDGTFGGIVGTAAVYTTITNCAVDGTTFDVEGVAGGIAGRLQTSAMVNACYFQGEITADVAGGIAGDTYTGKETVKNSHVDAIISASTYAGGVIGESHRSIVQNCFVEGEIEATSQKFAYAGGLLGSLITSYDANEGVIIQNNIVAATSISANAEAEHSIAHRIAGLTSGERWVIDWDNVTEDMLYSDYPHTFEKPESGMSGNYTLNHAIIDASVDDEHNTVEGKSIDAITDDILSQAGFAMGQSVESPWIKTVEAIALYFEGIDPELGIGSVGTDTPASFISYDGYSLYADGCSIAVYNAIGAIVAAGSDIVSVSQLAPGVYVAVAVSGDKASTMKFAKR